VVFCIRVEMKMKMLIRERCGRINAVNKQNENEEMHKLLGENWCLR